MMKVAIIVLLGLLSIASATRSEKEYQSLFTSWMRNHGKSYAHDDFMVRYKNFKNNLNEIDAYNALESGATLGLNKFSDLSREEFKRYYTGLKAKPADAKRNVVMLPEDNLATSVDWRTKKAVTPVKNQGDCGSCWSFSTTGSLEGLHAIQKGSLLSFSEQQLVDCSGSYGNEGCDGGLMDYAFQYVEKYGIETESDYPYTAEDGTCQYQKSKAVFTNKNYVDVATDNEKQLAAAVNIEPVSVAVEADQPAWQSYTGGIVTANCGTALDHGVLVVGYGTSGKQDYWIVKNSWGADWGESGYIRIAKDNSSNKPGVCGIAMQPSYPTL
jgi:C1A family cysteine protease